jgi:site-specific DNA-methyltransferase (adenine-specific)
MRAEAALYKGDTLEMMSRFADRSIDMILCDLPYGTTACKWDMVIPFEPLWEQYRRIIKPNGAIVLFGSQPFTSALITSNLSAFKYEWIYEKTNPKGFLSAKRRPLTAHENICVFSFGSPPYFPQKWAIPEHLRTKRKHATSKHSGECYGDRELKRWDDDGSRFPTSVIGFSNRVGRNENHHPTQKPLALMEYLIHTYTNESDLVLDNTMGSGTTGVACMHTKRYFAGIERDDKYFAIAEQRIDAAPWGAPK